MITKRESIAWTMATCLTLVLTIGMTRLSSNNDPQEESHQDSLRSLLLEKQEILTQLSTYANEAYANGTLDAEEVIRVNRELVETEIDLAESDEERLELRQKLVEISKNLEEFAQAHHDAGTASVIELYRARTLRIDAEIDLKREQLKMEE